VRATKKFGVGAVVLSVIGLSIGSTLVKSSGLPGPVAGFWRLLFSAVLWHIFIFMSGRRSGGPTRLTNEAWKLVLLPGLAFGINLSTFFTAVTKTSIAHSEFIGALTPLVVVPLASRRLREKVQPAVLGLAALAFAGISLVLFTGLKRTSAPPSLTGDFLGVCSIGTWTYYLLKSRSVRSKISTTHFMAGMTSVACITVIPIAIWRAGGIGQVADVSAKGWLMVGIMTITSGIISHGLVAWAQKLVPVSTISIMQVAQPGMATFWAWLLLDQGIAPTQVAGMLIVMGAIGAVAWLSSKSH
jgi:drug/metabolite transporter (DMT)-like permease